MALTIEQVIETLAPLCLKYANNTDGQTLDELKAEMRDGLAEDTEAAEALLAAANAFYTLGLVDGRQLEQCNVALRAADQT